MAKLATKTLVQRRHPKDVVESIVIRDIDYKPISSAQREFLQADLDKVFECTLGGPSGGGKTVALLISSLGPYADPTKTSEGCSSGTLLIDNPAYVGVIVRREATQLEKSGLINAANEWYTKFDPKVVYNSQLKKFTFSSGAQIWFRGCETDDDALKFKGYTRLHFVGFEELTQFTEHQYDIITTRLRDLSATIPLRVRATTNPGDINEEWVLERYKAWLYDKCITPLDTKIKCKFAQRLYRYVDESHPDLPIVISTTKPKVALFDTFSFIETGSKDILKDNVQNLGKIKDPVIRAQLLQGIWGLKGGAGMYFAENDLKQVDAKPRVASRVRYWDKACSGKSGDWLAGVLLARTPENKFVIEDVVLIKPEVHTVKNTILNTAKMDGKTVTIAIEQEGGSAGKEISFDYKTLLEKDGYQVIIDIKTSNKATSSKVSRAALLSPVMKEGNIALIAGQHPWKNEFIKQLINFPSKGVHDDAVDALTSAYLILTTKIPAPLAINSYMSFINEMNGALPMSFH